MSLELAIDVCVNAAIERGDFHKAVRMRWASHANYSATVEPAEIVDWIIKLRVESEKNFQMVGK